MSLVETKLHDLRAETRLDKKMVRPDQFGALDFFISQEGSLVDEARRAQIFASIGRDVNLPVLDYNGDVTVSSARSCVIPDAENTSKLKKVVFLTYQVGVSMTRALYLNNEIGYSKDFNRKMLNAVRALRNKMDQDALAALAASKTKVFGEKLGYTVTGDSVQCPYISRVDILGDLDSMMRANGCDGMVNVIGNYGVEALVRKLAQLGPQNAVNKKTEYAGKDFYTSINVANESGKYATLYAVEDGSVDILYRVDREAFLGSKGAGHEWFSAFLPGLDIPVGVHYYEEVGDKSALAGAASADMTCNLTEKYGISVDVAYVTVYNSAPETKASPFMKVEIAQGTGAGIPVNVNGAVTTS